MSYHVCICQFSGPTVEYGGWRFEFSERFGPILLNKNDTPKAQQPDERSPFWPVFQRWLDAGGYNAPEPFLAPPPGLRHARRDLLRAPRKAQP